MGSGEPVVIGGMVVDIHASPSVAVKPGTTTPGKVEYALGGVGRNIAECIFKLGFNPFMISALGLDLPGRLLLESWPLSIEGIKRSRDIETPAICNIFDEKGEELAAAVANEKFLTPEWIRNFELNIRSAPVVLVDANLSPHALVAASTLARKHKTPLWFEPVSVKKSERIAYIAKYITYTSPNADELVAMANALSSQNNFPSPVGTNSTSSVEVLFQKLKSPIQVLLDKGIEVVIVTLGSNGVFLCFKSTTDHVPKNRGKGSNTELYRAVNICCSPASNLSALNTKFGAIHFPAVSASAVRRLTGAGDCLVGAAIASLSAGLDLERSIAVGISAARAAVESERNVPPEFQLSRIAGDAGRVYSEAKVIFMESNL
ncbi:hypothetical protein M569_09722 [Genlisea aurea]|uniref:Carbohydrate kinase PfkB domain-containing protein n=1 Tax=Genlisea aurea TaxID=192259 RepID=S8DPP7_9LAMI|nr:hypothetical protein M569_09722 [Genlisea aurea]